MNPPSFSIQLKNRLSPETWPGIYLALQQDPLVWESLSATDLGGIVLESGDHRPDQWSPAALTLRAIGLPISLSDLTVTPLTSIAPPLQEKALQLYKNQAGKADRPPKTLVEAGWLALALRERRIYFGSWKGLAAEIKPRQNAAPPILACLFGMIPDPQEMLLELLNPASGIPQPALMLHAVLSNPLSLSRQVALIEGVLNSLPAELTTIRWLVVKELFQLRPALADRVAHDLSSPDTSTPPVSNTLASRASSLPSAAPLRSNESSPLLEYLTTLSQEGEAYQSTHQPGSAVPRISEAYHTARRLQAQLSAQLAQALTQVGETDENPQTLQAAQAAWKQAMELDPENPVYRAGHALALLHAGQVEDAAANLAPAGGGIKSQNQPASGPEQDEIPAAWLIASALIGAAQGSLNSLSQIAHQVLTRDLNLREVQPFLSDFCQLLFEQGLYLEADRIGRAAQIHQPYNLNLSVIQIQSQLKLGWTPTALHTALQAHALHPENLYLHRLLINCLEAGEEWLTAYQELAYRLKSKLPTSPQPGIIDPDTLDDLHDMAYCAIKCGEYLAARIACNQALANNPEDGVAYELLGQLSQILGDLPLALEHFEKATQFAPHRPLSWITLAKEYRRAGQNEKAIQILRIASQAVPDSPEIQLALGEIYLNENAPSQALVTLRRAAQLDQAKSLPEGHAPQPERRSMSTNRIALFLGRTLHQLGHYDEARRVYEAILKAQTASDLGRDDVLSHAYAQTLMALGEIKPALSLLETIIQFQPTNPEVVLDYARVVLELEASDQSTSESLRGTTTIHKVDPSMPTSHLPQVIYLLKTLIQEPEAGRQEAGSPSPSAKGYPHDPSLLGSNPLPAQELAQAYLAEALAQNGQPAEAEKAYRKAMETSLAQNPTWHSRLLLGYGKVAITLGKYDTAIAALQEAEQAARRNPRIAQALSEAYFMAGLMEEALQSAGNALQINPTDLNMLAWFAFQCLRIHQSCGSDPARLKAFQALERAVQLAPERGKLWVNLAETQLQYGNSEGARNTLNQFVTTLQADPDASPVHLSDETSPTLIAPLSKGLYTNRQDLWRAARCLEKLAAPGLAVVVLVQALNAKADGEAKGGSTQPTDLILLIELAENYRLAGNLQMALQTLERAIELEPDQADLYRLKAEVLVDLAENSNDIQNAIACLNNALRLQPDNPRFHWQMISLCYVSGNLTNALAYADQAILLGSSTTDPQCAMHPCAEYLAAETAFALLQPQTALEYLARRKPEAKDTFATACLQTEIIMDQNPDNLNEASVPLTEAIHLDSEHPRCLALQTRLTAHSEGRSEDALAALQTAFEVFNTNPEFQTFHGTSLRGNKRWSLAPGSLVNLRALAQAACAMGLWDEAILLFNQIVELAPQEPLAHLQLAQALVLRAEEQRLCQALDIVQHAPKPGALDAPARLAYETAIKNAQAPLIHNEVKGATIPTPEVLPDTGAAERAILRWKARGRAAFEPNPETAQALKVLLTQSVAPLLDDVLAWIMACNPSDAGMTNTDTPTLDLERVQAIAGSLYSQTPLIWLILAVSLRHRNPYQALQLAQHAGESPAIPAAAPPVPEPYRLILLAKLAHHLAHIADEQAATELKHTALLAIQAALDLWPAEPRWHAVAAEIYLDLEPVESGVKLSAERQAALSHLREAMRLEPDQVAHAIRLAQVLAQSNELPKAIELILEVIQTIPDQPDLWMALAQLQQQSGDLEQAALNAERAVELAAAQAQAQTTATALVLRGEIALQANNPRGAHSRALAALKIRPDHPRALYLCGRALNNLGQAEEALKVLEKAISLAKQVELQPFDVAFTHVQLVRKCHGLESGLEILQELLSDYPEDAQLLALQAEWLLAANRPAQACQSAQVALKVAPARLNPLQQANLHTLIGRQHQREGQLDQAIFHLNEAIALAPGEIEIYLELGRTHQERRQYGQALKVYQRAMHAAPNDYRPYQQAGLLLKESKDYPEAESMLRRAAQLAPQDVNIHRQLGAVVALNLVHSGRLNQPDRSGD